MRTGFPSSFSRTVDASGSSSRVAGTTSAVTIGWYAASRILHISRNAGGGAGTVRAMGTRSESSISLKGW